MNLDLSGKHALVAGGSDGIGHAAAIELAKLGADVTLLARREPPLRKAVTALPTPNASQRHGWIAVDMADASTLAAKVDALVSAHPVQILICNSGGPPGGPLAKATTQALLDVFNQHLIGGHVLLQAVLPGMQRASYGRVVNVISTSVKEPIAGLGVSNTIRGAVASWSKTLAGELAADGITVNNVLPGFTDTARLRGLIDAKSTSSGRSVEEVAADMRATAPAARFADPSEPAAAIAFLCSPAAAYINGINLPVDGGRTKSL
jgi:3-oxoacyl-[acyl-carrier protein] reductase